MNEFEGIIHQAPLGKGRPRATVRGGHARVYTPSATANWEHFAAQELRAAWEGKPQFTGVVECEIVAVFTRTAELLKLSKRHGYKYSTGRISHTGKPDLDNIIKATLDAAEKAGVLTDDKQVSYITAVKVYAALGEETHVELRIWSTP